MTRNLDAWFIDRDDSLIGNVLWKSFGNTSYPAQQLGWTKMDPFAVGSNEEVVQAVIEEKAWIAVVGKFYNQENPVLFFYNQKQYKRMLPLISCVHEKMETALTNLPPQLRSITRRYFVHYFTDDTLFLRFL